MDKNTLYVKRNNAWRTSKKLYVKQGDKWNTVAESSIGDYVNANCYLKRKYIWERGEAPPDEHTRLLLHFDEIPYVNSSNNANTVITSTGIDNVTSNGKFANSAIFPSDGSHYLDIEVTGLSTILSTNTWTFDWWEYASTFPDEGGAFILSSKGAYTMIAAYNHTYQGAGKYFYASSNGSSWDIANHVKAGNQLANQWIHRAIVRNGSSIKLFENGSLISEVTSSSLIKTMNDNIRFSYVWNNSGFNGYMDEFRFSDIARWTEAFTPPTEPYDSYQKIDYVESDNPNTYPINGLSDDGFYYKRL